jgi:hypothetical protein
LTIQTLPTLLILLNYSQHLLTIENATPVVINDLKPLLCSEVSDSYTVSYNWATLPGPISSLSSFPVSLGSPFSREEQDLEGLQIRRTSSHTTVHVQSRKVFVSLMISFFFSFFLKIIFIVVLGEGTL